MTTIDPLKCPHCGYLMDTIANMKEGGRPPRQGDFSLCLNCGTIFIFGEGMAVRFPDKIEVNAFELVNPDSFKELRRVQSLIFDRGPLPSKN